MSEKIIIATGPSECPKCGEGLPPPEILKPKSYMQKFYDWENEKVKNKAEIKIGDSFVRSEMPSEKILRLFVTAIETKWKKTTPPKELVEPLRLVKELKHD